MDRRRPLPGRQTRAGPERQAQAGPGRPVDVPAAAAAGQDGQPAADGQAAQGAENSGTGAGEDTFDDEEGEVGGWIQDVEGAGQ